jgi:hypothetical protein
MPRGYNIVDEAILQGRLWSPSVLRPALWLDAADISTITLSDSNVTQWNDKSGNARNLVQATAALRPTLTNSLLNGLSAITFASGNVLSTSANFPITGNPAFSVFYVYRKTTNTNGSVFGWGNSGGSLSAFGFYNNDTASAYGYAGVNSYIVTNPPNNVWNLMSYTKSPGAINTTSTSFRNGTDNSSTGSSANTPNIQSNLFSVGRWADYSLDSVLIGNVAEMIVLPTTATTATRQQVEGYLAWKWGLITSLLPTHPYINRPPLIGDN